MINPLFANLFFVTATAFMLIIVFVGTILVIHLVRLINIFNDILDSVKRTTDHIETTSTSFLSLTQALFGQKNEKTKRVTKKKAE